MNLGGFRNLMLEPPSLPSSKVWGTRPDKAVLGGKFILLQLLTDYHPHFPAPPIQNLVCSSAVNSEATTAKPWQRPRSLCIWGCRWNNTLESNRSRTDKAQAEGTLLSLFTVKHNFSIFPTKERTLAAAAPRTALSLWSMVSGARHSKGSCRAGVG